MRYIQEIILTTTMGFLALEIIPMYGELTAGLFGQISEGLGLARRGI